jgi:hypothetical protein
MTIERRMSVKTPEELLRAVVGAEDAGIQHAETCRVCSYNPHGKCDEGMRLAMDSIEALLDAKIWCDQTPVGV